MNEWVQTDHALAYLERADDIPHRREGEEILLNHVPLNVKRILDLGTGDGRLLALLKADRPDAQGIALDFSPTMLRSVRDRFAEDASVQVVEHDLAKPLPAFELFDAVVSSFAIHHLSDARKQEVYSEIFDLLNPGGVFCNLEHVASPNAKLHERFLQAIGYTSEEEDPSNQLTSAEKQLHWLRETGYEDVDCYWKWLELALLIGTKPE